MDKVGNKISKLFNEGSYNIFLNKPLVSPLKCLMPGPAHPYLPLLGGHPLLPPRTKTLGLKLNLGMDRPDNGVAVATSSKSGLNQLCRWFISLKFDNTKTLGLKLM